MAKRIGIVGAGRLGKALARSFKEQGYIVAGVSCDSAENSAVAAKELGVKAFADKSLLARQVEVLFLTVPDRLILSVAQELFAAGLPEGICLLHCSGALSEPLLPEASGVCCGSFHPLQSFASAQTDFAGVYVAVDGDEQAIATASELCAALDCKKMVVPAAERALYHAAACIASNHLVTLLSWSQGLMSRWTDTPQDALAALLPLIQGSLSNLGKFGAQKALTGPVVRGDAQTLARHLAVLPPELLEPYRMMSLYTLDLAVKGEALSEEAAQEIKGVLK